MLTDITCMRLYWGGGVGLCHSLVIVGLNEKKRRKRTVDDDDTDNDKEVEVEVRVSVCQ